MILETIFPLFFISLIVAMSFELLLNDFNLPELPTLPVLHLTAQSNRIIRHFRRGRQPGAIDKKERSVKNAEEHLRVCERKLTQAEAGKKVPWQVMYNKTPHLAIIERVDWERKRIVFLLLVPEDSMCTCARSVYVFTGTRPICVCAVCGETGMWQPRRVSYTPNTMKNCGAQAVHPFDAPAGYPVAELLVKYVHNEF